MTKYVYFNFKGVIEIQSSPDLGMFLCSQEAVNFARKGLQEGKTCSDVCCEILDFCISPDPKESRGIGCDNMTCCIVRFKDEFYLKHSDANLQG